MSWDYDACLKWSFKSGSVLPARTKVVWHTVSITVTTAKEEKPVRHGLRFFREEESPVSIVLHSRGGLAELWGVSSHWSTTGTRLGALRGK